jgi:hypothetical protein
MLGGTRIASLYAAESFTFNPWIWNVAPAFVKMITDTENIRKLAEDLEKQELDVSLYTLSCCFTITLTVYMK